MKKKITLSIVVDVESDLGVEDIVNNLNVEITPESENVEVDNYVVVNYFCLCTILSIILS